MDDTHKNNGLILDIEELPDGNLRLTVNTEILKQKIEYGEHAINLLEAVRDNNKVDTNAALKKLRGLLKLRFELENKAELLLDEEEKLLQYVKVVGTDSLKMDAIQWYFNDLVEMLRNYVTGDAERKDADSRLKRFIRALTMKGEKLQGDQASEEFSYFDYITRLDAEQFYEEAAIVCTGCKDGKRDYSQCKKWERKKCLIIKKKLGKKYGARLSEYLEHNNVSKYLENKVPREFSITKEKYYRIRNTPFPKVFKK